MKKSYKNGKVFIDGRLEDCGFAVEDGVIIDYVECGEEIDLNGDMIIPGLIDMHTHGRSGFDFMHTTPGEILKMKECYNKKGVTTVVPTLDSAPLEAMINKVAELSRLGFPAAHIEGRYLNPAKRGAHNPELLAPLNAAEVELFAEAAGDMHLHFSCAFELDTDGSFLRAVKAHGYTASIAHTTATYAQAMDCIERGVQSFTHLFNTMPGIHHREGGCIVSGLVSDAYVEIIVDGVHLSPETVKLVKKAKDPHKVILITDSMMGTDQPDGEFTIAGCPVTLKDGKAYTHDGALAGSTLELLNGVKNYVAFTGATLEEAISAATVNPATLLGLKGVGQLKTGYKADYIILSPDCKIREIYIDGEKIS